MTRNRQASRTVHLASPGSRRPHDQPFMDSPRRRRRLAIVVPVALAGLVMTQVVMAAPPGDLAINAPTTAKRGQAVQFTATGTGLTETMSYEWNFGDGTAVDTQPNPTHSYAGAAGPKTVTLTVADPAEPTAPPVTANHAISIENTPPTAEITRIIPAPAQPSPCGGSGQNPQVPLVGQQVVFAGTNSDDPDGDLDASTTENIKSYAWNFDEAGATANTAGAAHTYTTPGNKNVTLTVTDSDNATAIKTDPFRVNTVPEPKFISDDATPIIGQQVTFASTSTDADIDLPGVDERLTYAWDTDGDGFDDGTGPNATATFGSAGRKTIRLCVRDTGGVARMATKELLIQSTVPNGAFHFGPAAPLPGQPVTFTSQSTATAGKQLTTHEWDFAYDGDTFTPDASGASVQHSFATPGPKTVALRVSEAQPGGGPSTGGFDIVVDTVNVNAPPQASFTVAPETGFVGETVTLASTSSDPDGPLTKQEWDLDNDGQFDDANAAVVSAKFLKPRTYPLKLRVTDSRGASAIATKQVPVKRRPLPLLAGVVIGLGSSVERTSTVITRLRVKAPKNSTIAIRCVGKGCPKPMTKRLKRRRQLRFKAFERRLWPGAKLIVTVSRPGWLGRRTVFTVRRGRIPKRIDLCIAPGAKRAKRCPSE